MISQLSPSIRAVLLAFAVLPSVACSVDPAPADLDGLPRWFWVNYEAAAPEDVADAIVKLNTQSTNNAVEHGDPLKYKLKTRLVADDLETVGLKGKNDPSKARGVLLVNIIKCPLEKVEAVLYDLHQEKLYPDDYEQYTRTYTSDFEKYKSREVDTLTWDVSLQASHAGTRLNENLKGGLRWVPKADEAQFGPILLARTTLAEPAKTDDDDDYFRQDYQAEAYYEWKPGETLHMFAAWREAKFLGFDTEGDTLLDTQLGGFEDGDEALEKICQK